MGGGDEMGNAPSFCVDKLPNRMVEFSQPT